MKYIERKQQFLEKSRAIHNDRYDYSNIDYVNSYNKVEILCPKHGSFYQRPRQHSIGSGCPKCTKITRKDRTARIQEFITKSKNIHDGAYDYSDVDYVNSYTKVKITCQIHGSFNQRPRCHLEGSGCPICAIRLRTTSRDDFITKTFEQFGGMYTYPSLPDQVRFVDSVNIICPNHGLFKQRVNRHLNGHGCLKCSREKRRNDIDYFIKTANDIHDNRYDYSKTKYINCHTKVIVTCKEHGDFLVAPANHTKKTNPTGCRMCRSSRGQNKIRSILSGMNIPFIEEHRFDDCRNTNPLPFDFFIPSKNILIEFDGEQHFLPIPYFGGEESFNKTKINDVIKNQYAEDNNIKLIRIPYTEMNNIETILRQVP